MVVLGKAWRKRIVAQSARGVTSAEDSRIAKFGDVETVERCLQYLDTIGKRAHEPVPA
ncbi:MAG: hypothetical protein H0T80_05800 [Betaproteobacteria bacterium]|nr:hypothetical protein [Betaproteobacteria bacterium]